MALTAATGREIPKLTFPPSQQDCSQLRELSLCLLSELLRSVVTRDERRMRREVRKALIPLLFRLNDRFPSVAKVGIGRLSTDVGGLTPSRDCGHWDKGCWHWAGLPQCSPWEGSLWKQHEQGWTRWLGHFNTCPACSSWAWQQFVGIEAAPKA